MAVAVTERVVANEAPAALNGSLQEIAQTLLAQGADEVVLAFEHRENDRIIVGAARENGKKADEDRLFQIGSQTKWFTAAAVVLLEKDGKLHLDDPVSDYITGVADAEGVLLKHLLNHSSGIGDGVALLDERETPPEGAFTFEELSFASRLKGRQFEPGTGFAYNNYGFDVLGKVVEAVSGQTRAAFIRAHILKPLGMAHTYFGEMETWPAAPAARGFYFYQGVAREATGPRDLSWAAAAGDMISSAGDLLLWLTALEDPDNPTGLVLSDFKRFLSSSAVHSPDMPHYGLGIMHRNFGGRGTWGHGGFIHGYVTYSGIDERSGIRFIALASVGDDGDANRLRSAIVTAIGTCLHLSVFAHESKSQ